MNKSVADLKLASEYAPISSLASEKYQQRQLYNQDKINHQTDDTLTSQNADAPDRSGYNWYNPRRASYNWYGSQRTSYNWYSTQSTQSQCKKGNHKGDVKQSTQGDVSSSRNVSLSAPPLISTDLTNRASLDRFNTQSPDQYDITFPLVGPTQVFNRKNNYKESITRVTHPGSPLKVTLRYKWKVPLPKKRQYKTLTNAGNHVKQALKFSKHFATTERTHSVTKTEQQRPKHWKALKNASKLGYVLSNHKV